MKSKFQPIVIAVLICILVSTSFVWSAREIEVPLLVNVQKGVTITPDQIAAMVAEANKILKQADIKIKFNKETDIKNPFDDKGNNNDKIESGEDKALDPAAVKELEKHHGKDKPKGVKIVISNEIHGKPGTLGLAPHDPKNPVIYLKNGQTAKKGGNTIAHEFCHVFTLGPKHKVTDTTNADPNGHISIPSNLMHPTADDGDKLTDEQREELRKGAAKNGKKEGVLTYGWRSFKSIFNYQSANPVELTSSSFTFLRMDGLYTQNFRFGGNVTPGDPVMLVAAFDPDNDPGTGRDILLPDGSTAFGIDRTLEILIDGDPTIGGAATANLLDEVGNLIVTLDIEYENVPKIVDDWVAPTSYNIYDRVTVSFDEPLMLLDPVFSSVVVYSYLMSDPMQYDILDPIEVEFPVEPAPSVMLDRTQAVGGEMIMVTGENFYGNDPNVLVQFDDVDMGKFMTDASGLCLASFAVPADAKPGSHFITLSTIDPVGGLETKYAFTMLEVTADFNLVDFSGLASTWMLYEDDLGFNDDFNYIEDSVIDIDDLWVFCRNWLNSSASP